ncbi:hypothetical protein IF2G_03312 [Cordyceps javanica]|nr:hypothetical protein IF2G_03312 [Cordyceps javanica]
MGSPSIKKRVRQVSYRYITAFVKAICRFVSTGSSCHPSSSTCRQTLPALV